MAFAKQLRYTVSPARAKKLLGTRGELSVQNFLSLLQADFKAPAKTEASAEKAKAPATIPAGEPPAQAQKTKTLQGGVHGGVQVNAAQLDQARRKNKTLQRLNSLPKRAREVLSQLRATLLQRSNSLEAVLQAAQSSTDLEGAEFLAVLEGVGLAVLDDDDPRVPDGTAAALTQDEATNLLVTLGFGSKGNKPGTINCTEFLRLLRDAKLDALNASEPVATAPSFEPPARGTWGSKISAFPGAGTGRVVTQGQSRWLPESYKGVPDETHGFVRAAVGVNMTAKGHVIKGEGGKEVVRQAFKRWDVNGDGSISGDELFGVLKDLDPRFTAESVKRMFQEADKNGDGTIDYREFTSWLFQ
mmetsp:Transcript_399/g.723  ORF Transcript_399/g.723 Transcript_399/m.723 type:complete len:358 (+) Transcript_399:1-1074(+)